MFGKSTLQTCNKNKNLTKRSETGEEWNYQRTRGELQEWPDPVSVNTYLGICIHTRTLKMAATIWCGIWQRSTAWYRWPAHDRGYPVWNLRVYAFPLLFDRCPLFVIQFRVMSWREGGYSQRRWSGPAKSRDLRDLKIYMRTILFFPPPMSSSLWCWAVGRWPVAHWSEFGDFIGDVSDCWFVSVWQIGTVGFYSCSLRTAGGSRLSLGGWRLLSWGLV